MNCQHCKTPFTPTFPGQICCTDKCAKARASSRGGKATKNQPKLYKCKNCKLPFQRISTTQVACSWPCAIAIAEKIRHKESRLAAKAQRLELREAKAKLKTRREYLKEAQAVFNSWIRYRDRGLPCISCGTTKNVQYAAGHYRTTGAAGHLRFNEDNVHKQCNKYCNMKLSGNIVNYRPALIMKIGLERVIALENDNSTCKFTIDDLKKIKAEYTKRLKEP